MTETTLPTTTEVRARAAELLMTRGWRQGGWADGAGRICAAGALYAASCALVTEKCPELEPWRLFGTWAKVDGAALDEIHAELRAQGCPVNLAYWNDVPGRTFDEVLELLTPTAVQPLLVAAGGERPDVSLMGRDVL